jgi:hypothetical protein
MHKLLLFLFSFSITVAQSQTPSLTIHLIETPSNDYEIGSLIPLPDKTYGVFGNNISQKYMVFIKMDSLGNVLLNKKYQFSAGVTCEFSNAIVTKSGEIAVVGTEMTTFEHNVMFLRLNLNGDLIGSKFYSGYSRQGFDAGHSLVQTPDAGFIFAGNTEGDNLLIKTDSVGTRQWTKRFGSNSTGAKPTGLEIIGNSIYIAGYFYDRTFNIHKFDTNGNFVWTKTVSTLNELSQKIIKTADNKLVVGGAGNFMMKIDTNGAFIWQRHFPTTSTNYGMGTVTATPDGGFVTCATQNGVFANILSDGYVTKFNALGEMQWVRRIGTVRNDEVKMIANAHDGRGYFVLGRCTDINVLATSTIFLARLGNDGYMPSVSCEYMSEIEVASPASYVYSYNVGLVTFSPLLLGITSAPQGTLTVSNDYKMTKLSVCNNDIELTEIISPNSVYCATASLPVQVRITNKGKQPVHRLTATYLSGSVIYGSTNSLLNNFINLNILPQKDTILTIATLNNPVVGNSILTANLYTLINEFADINKNNNSLTKTIRYNPLTPIITATQLTVCPNDSITFLTAVSGSGYQWFRNNDTLRGATNSSIVVKDNASYFVTVRNTDNCSYKSNVLQPVLGTRPTAPTIVRSGTTLTATNTTATSFQWYFNGNLIANASQATYSATQNGNYTVVSVVSGCTSVASVVYNYVLSAAQDLENQAFTVQPNPLRHTLQVTGLTDLTTIVIYDFLGQLMYQKNMDNKSKTVILDNLNFANGSYLLKAIDVKNRVFVKKITVIE